MPEPKLADTIRFWVDDCEGSSVPVRLTRLQAVAICAQLWRFLSGRERELVVQEADDGRT